MTTSNLTKLKLISTLKSMNQDISYDRIANLYYQIEAIFIDTLKNGNETNVFDCGKLKIKRSAPRKGRNPRTGKEIKIPAKNRVVFKTSKKLNGEIQN